MLTVIIMSQEVYYVADVQQLNALNQPCYVHGLLIWYQRGTMPSASTMLTIYSASGIILRCMCIIITTFDTLRPEQNYRHFADDILKTFSWRKIKASFLFKLHQKSTLFKVIAWLRTGDKPPAEQMLSSFT